MSEKWQPPPGWGNLALKEFEEVALPETISFFPATQFWVWITGFASLVLLLYLVNRYTSWKRNKYRREALALLATIRSSSSTEAPISRLPALLKQIAMRAYGREKVAALYGAEWISFLNSNCQDSPFDKTSGDRLLALAYQPNRPVESSALLAATEHWIRNHA